MHTTKAEKLEIYKSEIKLLKEANDLKILMKDEHNISITILDALTTLKAVASNEV